MRLFALFAAACCGLFVLSGVPRTGATELANTSAAFVDSFNQAHDADPHYGLNDNLTDRQTGSIRGITYTRVPGL